MRQPILRCVIGLAALLLPGTASAYDELNINNIIRSLAPIEGSISADRNRPSARRNVHIDGQVIHLDARYALDMEVYFPFDSANLTVEARKQLYALGRALESSRLRPYRYLIAGHTDAKGSADYNRSLSLQRARAVRVHLVSHFAVDPHRLDVVGFGEDWPKNPSDPVAAVNRRVEVVMIASPAIEQKRPDSDISVTITIE